MSFGAERKKGRGVNASDLSETCSKQREVQPVIPTPPASLKLHENFKVGLWD